MCFKKNKEMETIDDRIEYTKKIANLLNNLIQGAFAYGKNINNNTIIEQPNVDKVLTADRAQYNLIRSMMNFQIEDIDGLYSFCTIRGLKRGEIPHFEFKDRKDFLL